MLKRVFQIRCLHAQQLGEHFHVHVNQHVVNKPEMYTSCGRSAMTLVAKCVVLVLLWQKLPSHCFCILLFSFSKTPEEIFIIIMVFTSQIQIRSAYSKCVNAVIVRCKYILFKVGRKDGNVLLGIWC